MVFKKIKPTTPSQRHLIQVNTKKLLNNNFINQNNSNITDTVFKSLKNKPIKKLTKGLKKHSGRNNYGRITVRHRGGGHKRKYRQIEFKRTLNNGIVQQIEYDPNRSAFIARVKINDSEKLTKEIYILAPKNLEAGMQISCAEETSIQIGNAMLLKNIPIGSLIHNISFKPNKRGQYIRAAGTFGQLIQKTKKYARIKLPSGEHRYAPLSCFATLGIISNENHMNEQLGKAGRSRWLGKRPAVRGVAMNPVDHPHGGGEGKTGTKRPSVTPWARHTKGKPTRNKRKVKKDKKNTFKLKS
jgi:large subunit ribosomal protein L2